LRVNATTVVADENAEMFRSIFQFDFDVPCAGFAEGIHQHFTANTVDFIADNWMQRPGPPFDSHAKPNLFPSLLMDGEFLLDTGKCLFEIERVSSNR
jgi:hypothetical protein